MRWKDECSVGIEEIDKQHRVLLDYFGLMEDTVASGASLVRSKALGLTAQA